MISITLKKNNNVIEPVVKISAGDHHYSINDIAALLFLCENGTLLKHIERLFAKHLNDEQFDKLTNRLQALKQIIETYQLNDIVEDAKKPLISANPLEQMDIE